MKLAVNWIKCTQLWKGPQNNSRQPQCLIRVSLKWSGRKCLLSPSEVTGGIFYLALDPSRSSKNTIHRRLCQQICQILQQTCSRVLAWRARRDLLWQESCIHLFLNQWVVSKGTSGFDPKRKVCGISVHSHPLFCKGEGRQLSELWQEEVEKKKIKLFHFHLYWKHKEILI